MDSFYIDFTKVKITTVLLGFLFNAHLEADPDPSEKGLTPVHESADSMIDATESLEERAEKLAQSIGDRLLGEDIDSSGMRLLQKKYGGKEEKLREDIRCEFTNLLDTYNPDKFAIMKNQPGYLCKSKEEADKMIEILKTGRQNMEDMLVFIVGGAIELTGGQYSAPEDSEMSENVEDSGEIPVNNENEPTASRIDSTASLEDKVEALIKPIADRVVEENLNFGDDNFTVRQQYQEKKEKIRKEIHRELDALLDRYDPDRFEAMKDQPGYLCASKEEARKMVPMLKEGAQNIEGILEFMIEGFLK